MQLSRKDVYKRQTCMKQLGISIIGTDTDVGKTFVTGLLGAMAVDDGFAVGMRCV